MSVSSIIIDATFAAGRLLAPVVEPLERLGLALVPETLLKPAQDWLRLNASAHAKSLPLMNPFHVVLIILAYLAVVYVSLRVFGRDSVPKLNVKEFALFHNFLMVSLSGYMCLSILYEAFFNKGATGYRYSLFANPADETQSGWAMAKVVWVFYFSKILEFTDTYIMIMKKNFRQVSFLHVYHHSSIFAIWWLVTFMAPTGEAYFSAALNSFIHVVMYGYYFFSAIGVKQVAFVKKYITMMQMTQFCMMMVQATYDLVHAQVIAPGLPAPKAPFKLNTYPPLLSGILFVYMISMLALFYNFFKADRKREKEAKGKVGAKANGKANGKTE